MSTRLLSDREWAGLSLGLADALAKAGAKPLIDNRAHVGAYVASVRFRSLPIVAAGRTIWWPNARDDFAGRLEMGVLQHELQHILDYAEGRLSVIGYLFDPRNWTYDWERDATVGWDNLGAEQRASMTEALWRAERSPVTANEALRLRKIIPWARAAINKPDGAGTSVS